MRNEGKHLTPTTRIWMNVVKWEEEGLLYRTHLQQGVVENNNVHLTCQECRRPHVYTFAF